MKRELFEIRSFFFSAPVRRYWCQDIQLKLSAVNSKPKQTLFKSNEANHIKENVIITTCAAVLVLVHLIANLVLIYRNCKITFVSLIWLDRHCNWCSSKFYQSKHVRENRRGIQECTIQTNSTLSIQDIERRQNKT
jgi:hypothetical protein